MIAFSAVVYLVLCILVGLCGRRRRFGFFGFFVLAFLTTPLLGVLVLYLTQERPGDSTRPRLRNAG